MPYLALFFRLIVRPMLREGARTALVVAAVALGVAVVLAIDLAGNAAAGSFRSSMETLSGDNDLEVTAAGGVPEKLIGDLARLPYPLRIGARIEDHATVVTTGETFHSSASTSSRRPTPASRRSSTSLPTAASSITSTTSTRSGSPMDLGNGLATRSPS